MYEGNNPAIKAVFDREDLLDTVDGDMEILEQLVEMFLNVVPGQMENIRAALGQGDFPGAQREAHKLKGTAANMRASSLHTAFAGLEEAVKRQDAARAGQMLATCSRGFDNFIEVYRTGLDHEDTHHRR